MNGFAPCLRAAICALVCCGAGGAGADEPLEPPQSRKIFGASKKCWVYTDAASQTTTAYERGNGKTRKLWSIPGWFRVAAPGSDCRHFVTGYDGVNLLPDKFAHDTAMLSFYHNGTLIRRVVLTELVKDLAKLEKTTSHWSWGHYIGIEQGTRYRVTTVDRGDVVFDMTTGQPVE